MNYGIKRAAPTPGQYLKKSGTVADNVNLSLAGNGQGKA
ncbi:hypothetical protein GGD41_001818 [Paraburkholderia bryophila]|uniref:Uncharacterized protein n=1 Tax=Paraburkholderia bryophila TaxID=420952 RepID=A0A7Z0BC26_9BURK|nr:hypothetical protein [Paraburkholderia bryophila]NYH27082.1 hypothetical protein [Paraburkholderia bryophila]